MLMVKAASHSARPDFNAFITTVQCICFIVMLNLSGHATKSCKINITKGIVHIVPKCGSIIYYM